METQIKDERIITPYDELVKLIKDRATFYFCMAFALNKGLKADIREKKEITFTVGDYEVTLNYEQSCFILIHKIYFLRIVHAYLDQTVFTGTKEEEVINDLLFELAKEK